MATWLLTPNTANSLTGLTNPVIGWQLTIASALDTLTGCNAVYRIGWRSTLLILADSVPTNPIWQLLLVKGTTPNLTQIVINDTDWLVTDGLNVWDVAQSVVESTYTVTQVS
jgi:hypothetical protein